MSNKNFDRAFYFTYSPGMSSVQSQSMLNIDFGDITAGYNIVDIKQSTIQDKVVVTLFAKKK